MQRKPKVDKPEMAQGPFSAIFGHFRLNCIFDPQFSLHNQVQHPSKAPSTCFNYSNTPILRGFLKVSETCPFAGPFGQMSEIKMAISQPWEVRIGKFFHFYASTSAAASFQSKINWLRQRAHLNLKIKWAFFMFPLGNFVSAYLRSRLSYDQKLWSVCVD